MKHFRHETFEEAILSFGAEGYLLGSDNETINEGNKFENVASMEEYAGGLLACAKSITEEQRMVVDIDILPEQKGFSNEPLPFETVVFGLESQSVTGTGSLYDPESGLSVSSELAMIIAIEAEVEGVKVLIVQPIGRTEIAGSLKRMWLPSSSSIWLRRDTKAVKFKNFPGLNAANTDASKDHLLNALRIVDSTCTLVGCSNVTIEKKSPSKLRLMRAKKNKQTLKPFNVIKLPAKHYEGSETSGGGHHASPSLHHRRGHYRTLHRGERYERRVWVRPCMVGDSARGTVKHEYVIRSEHEKSI